MKKNQVPLGGTIRDLLETDPLRFRYRELLDAEPPNSIRELLSDIPLKPRYIGPEPWLALVRERSHRIRETAGSDKSVIIA